MEGEEERRRFVASRWGDEAMWSWDALLSGASLLIAFGVEDIGNDLYAVYVYFMWL